MRPDRSEPRWAPAATPPANSPSRPRPPRRTLSRLDADALAAAVGAWLAERDRGCPKPAASRRRAVAIDGKTLRGARRAGADGRPAHLLACTDHTTRTVLTQRQVGGAPEEVPAFALGRILLRLNQECSS